LNVSVSRNDPSTILTVSIVTKIDSLGQLNDWVSGVIAYHLFPK